MIELEQVSKHYNEMKAVDEVSLSIKEGETVVLLGTSGCGKTTTLRMINRLIEPTSGKITVDGKNIKEQPAEVLRRGIGYVLQHHGLFPHYTVAENIAIVPNLLKWSKNKTAKRVVELLEKLQLPTSAGSLFPAALSGGQQQRVGLARALAVSSPVLLMDEPLGALDPVTRQGIRREFKNLDELKRKTILMVTHDIQEAFELADRICLMNKGKIVQIGTAKELLFNPSTEFVATFLKEQQFQLELESITLRDVWPFLPKAIDGIEERSMLPEANLWQAIEAISAANLSASPKFFATIKNDKKQVDVASLMAGYTQFKKAVKHE